MTATRYSPITYSDYNALYNTVYTILGAVSDEVGYGQTSLYGSAYPFTKTINLVTKAAIAQVTTATPHRLVAGELIFISNIAAGMTQLSDQYAKVYAVIDSTNFTITVDTRTYTTWSGTGTVQQFVVSANQFNNLRVDLAKARKHQTGSEVTTTDLPLVTRGDIINFNVYTPFYNICDLILQQKYILGEYSIHQPANSPFSRTASWQNSLVVQLEIEWPNRSDAQQFFNTGGLVVFDVIPSNKGAGASATNDTEWYNLMTANFPIRYGARNKTTMGYTDASKWASGGFYDANGLDQQIYSATVANSTYNTNNFTMTHRSINDKRIRFVFTWNDGHSNVYSQDVNVDFEFHYYLYYSTGGIALTNNPAASTNPYSYVLVNAFNGPGNS